MFSAVSLPQPRLSSPLPCLWSIDWLSVEGSQAGAEVWGILGFSPIVTPACPHGLTHSERRLPGLGPSIPALVLYK